MKTKKEKSIEEIKPRSASILKEEYDALYSETLKRTRELIRERGSLYKCAKETSEYKGMATFARIMKNSKNNIDLLFKVCFILEDSTLKK